jgi:hypothetical protein
MTHKCGECSQECEHSTLRTCATRIPVIKDQPTLDDFDREREDLRSFGL